MENTLLSLLSQAFPAIGFEGVAVTQPRQGGARQAKAERRLSPDPSTSAERQQRAERENPVPPPPRTHSERRDPDSGLRR